MHGNRPDAQPDRLTAAGNQYFHSLADSQRDAHPDRDANTDPKPNTHPLHRDAHLPAAA